MKSKFVKLFLLFVLVTVLFEGCFSVLVNADTNTVKYYSINGWLDKVNYVNGDYVGTHYENTIAYINDSGSTPVKVSFNVNLFGDNSYPYTNPSINRLTSDNDIYNISKVATDGQYRYFMIHFYENIKISELEYKIKITGNDGTNKNKEVLINPIITSAGSGNFSINGGTRVNTSFSNDKEIVNCNYIEGTSIVIKAINAASDDKIEFSHFQINKYQAYIHESWSTTKPSYNTIIKSYTYNDANGLWSGDGSTSNTNWMKSSTSSFYGSVTGNYDYSPSIGSWKWVDWNWKDDGRITAWDFNEFKKSSYAIDLSGDFSSGWYKLNSTSGKSGYYSAGIFNYDSNTGSGTEYALLPSYWNNSNNNNGGARSYDDGWCRWAGTNGSICYRHDNAQSSDSRKNMFAVFKRTISNVVPTNNQSVKYVDYYVCDVNGNNCNYNTRIYGNNVSYNLVLNNLTGSYKLKAKIVDNSSLTSDVYRYSNVINLDNTKPSVIYQFDESSKGLNNWYNKLAVNINPDDSHSGVNKWRYCISKDSGKNYGNWSNWITVDYKSIILNETAAYKIKTEVYDNVGNQTLIESDVKKVDVDKPYVIFSPGDEDLNIHAPATININPEDDDSGIQTWRYSISNDDGVNYDKISDWYLDGQSNNVLLCDKGINIIKVELIDNAGNSKVIYSNRYYINEATIKIQNMITNTYEIGNVEKVYTQINFIECSSNDNINIKFFVNNKIVKEINKKYDGTLDYVFDYIPDANILSTLKIIGTVNPGVNEVINTMELIAYEKTKEIKESNLDTISFEAITASSNSYEEGIAYYKEYFTVSAVNEKNEYYSGQPLEEQVNVNYFNECEKIINYACDIGNDLYSSLSYAIYNDGASPVKNSYQISGGYKVPMEYDQNNNNYLLPIFFADKYTGYIYTESNKKLIESDRIIEAGNKWYTNPFQEIGNYNYSYNSEESGINKFKWKLNRDYKIIGPFTDLYRVRFVEPENPFPNNETEMWKNSKLWFESLEE
jgi:hypothetical protein